MSLLSVVGSLYLVAESFLPTHIEGQPLFPQGCDHLHQQNEIDIMQRFVGQEVLPLSELPPGAKDIAFGTKPVTYLPISTLDHNMDSRTDRYFFFKQVQGDSIAISVLLHGNHYFIGGYIDGKVYSLRDNDMFEKHVLPHVPGQIAHMRQCGGGEKK